MNNCFKSTYCLIALLILTVSLPVQSATLSLGAGKPYALIQLGDDGGDTTSNPGSGVGDKLEITSNSTVFGSTLKGVDGKPELNKISSSRVTGSFDRESGVSNDISSSQVASQNTLDSTTFETIAADARALSSYWAGQSGTDVAVNENGTTLTLTASGGLGTVYNVTDGFILNSGARLVLDGGVGDFFVFNISDQHEFNINTSIIELTGDITASEVLFNVLGNVGSATIIDDNSSVNSHSIFQGTLLAVGRDVTIQGNHFHTYDDNSAANTTEVTAADAIAERATDPTSAGVFGQIVAGQALLFDDSDISYQPFMAAPVPLPATIWLLGTTLLGLLGVKRKH